EGAWVEGALNEWIVLNQDTLRRHKLRSAEVEAELADWLGKQPGIQAAVTRTHLLKKSKKEDPVVEQLRRSFYPSRCGDVVVVLKPYHLVGEPLKTGTTHGSPHPYDTHVPLVVYGPGVRRGVRLGRVSPLSLAAIFAHAVGAAPPAQADTPLPADLFNPR